MLARLLHLAGAALPQDVIGATADNVHGHWEPVWINDRNAELLAAMGSSWKDWSRLDPDSLPAEERQNYVADVRGFLRSGYPAAGLILVKEPRLCRLFLLFAQALAAEDIRPLVVIPWRHPLEVATSLRKRDGMSLREGVLLWLRHCLDAERTSRGLARSFISYESVLTDWRAEFDRMARQLGIAWPAGDALADSLPQAIDLQARHNVWSEADLAASGFACGMALTVMECFARLAADPADAAAMADLDEVGARFDELTELTYPAHRDLTHARAELAGSLEQAQAEQQRLTARNAELERNLGAIYDLQHSVSGLNQKAEQLVADLRARLADTEAALARTRAEHERLTAEAAAAHRQELQRRDRQDCDRAQVHGRAVADLQADHERRVAELTAAHQQELAGQRAEMQGSLDEETARGHQYLLALSDTQAYVEVLKQDLDRIRDSWSWTFSAPVRVAGRSTRAARPMAAQGVRMLWHHLPVTPERKQSLKARVFSSSLGQKLLGQTAAYQAWQQMRRLPVPGRMPAPRAARGAAMGKPGSIGTVSADTGQVVVDTTDHFVGKRVQVAPESVSARVICFYLPQFHAIPQNDEWWGKGFTEWTNVRPAQPMFPGHYQPHEPLDELGHYDLTDIDTQRRQIALARLYGIGGFCFYWYWFDGQRLLERPVRQWLDNPDLDFPFCICWANENWTRRWDGKDAEILMGQNHSPEDDLAFIADLAPYLRDPRYIRIDGRPLVLVYRPQLLPDAAATAARWRDWCRDNGIGRIYLAYTQSFESVDPAQYGFDAAVEFPPNNASPTILTERVPGLDPQFEGIVYDWNSYVDRSRAYPPVGYHLFRSVCPGWDNTARRKKGGAIFLNNTPGEYSVWLSNALTRTAHEARSLDERIIFCNAWNEWAEGAHLEPDTRSGYAYLEATRDVITSGTPPRHVTLIGHDAHPHGAQLLLLNLARSYSAAGLRVTMLLLGDGPLIDDYAVATDRVIRLPDPVADPDQALALLRAIRYEHTEPAIANTTVSGAAVPLLKQAGYRVVSLVHEMTSVYAQMNLAAPMSALTDHADRVVFPARLVREQFEASLGRAVEQAVIRPQGLYLRAAPGDANSRATLRTRLGLAPDSVVVLGVGYIDHRKGADLFVRAIRAMRDRGIAAQGVWIGHWDGEFIGTVRQLARDLGIADAIHLPGRVTDPQAFYGGADLFLLTSREDPYPSVVLEAMAAELPVVMFAGTTGTEDLARRGLAVAVPAEDAAAMAQAAVALIRDPEARRAMTGPAAEMVARETGFADYAFDLLALAGRPLPRISVIVPSYNYERYIADRLHSVLAQDMPILEIIVLDDCSTDRSADIIRDIVARSDAPIHFVPNEVNSGNVFRQWRKGLDMARGDYVWIAEADDLAAPDFLSTTMRGFEDPRVVLSYCESAQIDGEGNPLAGDYRYYTDPTGTGRWDRNFIAPGSEEIALGLSVRNTIPNASAVVMKTDVLRDVFACHGDEIAGLRFAGDWAVYLHMAERGAVAFCALPRNLHRRHGSSVTISNFNHRQLDEIAAMQALATRLAEVPAGQRAKATDYLNELWQRFGQTA